MRAARCPDQVLCRGPDLWDSTMGSGADLSSEILETLSIGELPLPGTGYFTYFLIGYRYNKYYPFRNRLQ